MKVKKGVALIMSAAMAVGGIAHMLDYYELGLFNKSGFRFGDTLEAGGFKFVIHLCHKLWIRRLFIRKLGASEAYFSPGNTGFFKSALHCLHAVAAHHTFYRDIHVRVRCGQAQWI